MDLQRCPRCSERTAARAAFCPRCGEGLRPPAPAQAVAHRRPRTPYFAPLSATNYVAVIGSRAAITLGAGTLLLLGYGHNGMVVLAILGWYLLALGVTSLSAAVWLARRVRAACAPAPGRRPPPPYGNSPFNRHASATREMAIV